MAVQPCCCDMKIGVIVIAVFGIINDIYNNFRGVYETTRLLSGTPENEVGVPQPLHLVSVAIAFFILPCISIVCNILLLIGAATGIICLISVGFVANVIQLVLLCLNLFDIYQGGKLLLGWIAFFIGGLILAYTTWCFVALIQEIQLQKRGIGIVAGAPAIAFAPGTGIIQYGYPTPAPAYGYQNPRQPPYQYSGQPPYYSAQQSPPGMQSSPAPGSGPGPGQPLPTTASF